MFEVNKDKANCANFSFKLTSRGKQVPCEPTSRAWP